MINGRLSAPFLIERSVRQGCPLSPLFYALASTPMFYLLEAKMNSKYIHVGFAEDTFIFAREDESYIRNILTSLASFSETHLGYPLGVNVPTNQKIQWVFRRIKCRMELIRIVQAFLQPFVMYDLLLLDWKRSHLYAIDGLVKSFLWDKKHNRALVISAWDFVCQPKDKGGLGILDLGSPTMARWAAFLMRILFPYKPLWTDIFWRFIENAVPLSFPVIRRTYAVGPVYRSKWIQIILLQQRYQVPLSIDASDPWCDWLLAKHTRWWNGKASIFYGSIIRSDGIALQCNKRWKLNKSPIWWHARFCTIWESSFTFKMKIFMWRILVGHFTSGAFLSKHGLKGGFAPIFSWSSCKIRMRLDIDVMLAEDRIALASLLDAL
ncbi:hypothetical protein KP509_25G024800 [Ceratopteris richardii]|uniref:Reverse transcriptase domain-containing protein n=1 Tax=Ceratopteris richardii TaxID=49495 RepID=A0A8T2RNG9_CERRI|nr:hypothetical protein KP509_25G024800 [Ceratopteris richardii]